MSAVAEETAARWSDARVSNALHDSSTDEQLDSEQAALECAGADSWAVCFNCRHPLPPSSAACDNCGLPLPLPLPTASEVEPPPSSPALRDAGAVACDKSQLHLLLDACGVCGEALSRGPLCFLPCGHLIHERHRLVYRHCSLCHTSLPPYSSSDAAHCPTEAEAEHYRARREAERRRYGADKGPCCPIFLEPLDVARLLVFGEDDAAEQGSAAMERAMDDGRREADEAQRELKQQAEAESDTRRRVNERSEALSNRKSSLARRRERCGVKKQRLEQLRMDVYAIGRECSTLEKESSRLAQHSARHADKDRQALSGADEEAASAMAAGHEERSAVASGEGAAESEQRRRARALLQASDEAASRSQLQALHVRFTHLHNSRCRQLARNEREQDALNKQHGEAEAASRALRAECASWASQLAAVQGAVSEMGRREAKRRRVAANSATDRAGRAQAQPASAPSGVCADSQQAALDDALSSSSLTASLSVRLASVSPADRSCTPSSHSHHTRALTTARTPRVTAHSPSAAASARSFAASPTASPRRAPAASSAAPFAPLRRFPSFSSASQAPPFGRLLSGVDGKGGRVLLTASGVAVPQQQAWDGPGSSRSGTRAAGAQSGAKRAAAEANGRGALDRFVLHLRTRRRT